MLIDLSDVYEETGKEERLGKGFENTLILKWRLLPLNFQPVET